MTLITLLGLVLFLCCLPAAVAIVVVVALRFTAHAQQRIWFWLFSGRIILLRLLWELLN